MPTVPRIAVVGSINTDLVVYAKALPRPGETVRGGDLFQGGGGKGANQAVAAARLGASVHLIGRLGDDSFAEAAAANLTRLAVDITYVAKTANTPSGVALIVVDDKGQNLIAVSPGANARLTATDTDAAAASIQGAAVLLLQLEVPLAASMRAAELARAAGATVILNPAPAPTEPLPPDFLRMVDVIVPNESEAAAIAGPDAEPTALLRLGPSTAIVTRGDRGALVVTSSGITAIPVEPVEAVDATGAGDAFCGALAFALALGREVDEAARFANRAATVSVTRRGAQDAMPSMADLRETIVVR